MELAALQIKIRLVQADFFVYCPVALVDKKERHNTFT
jgi:hypothetical protein